MTTDATQHPLYRPHHGDMTGWRFLEKYEFPRIGDQWVGRELGIHPSKWLNQETDEDWPVSRYDTYAHRRRISSDSPKPAPEQTEPKRFVTVVFPGDARNLETFLQHAVTYREGNYLEKFDGIKDRVNQALEGEGV